jgi:S1-C subfamily serine protease
MRKEQIMFYQRCVSLALFVFFCLSLISMPHFVMAQADKVFEQNSPCVVVVHALDANNKSFGQGSGSIIRNDGVIVTNFHVIDGAVYLQVKVGKDKYYWVKKIVYKDPTRDFAILKIETSDMLPVVKLGDSENVKQGQKIYLIGSPLGLENTLSDGLVSGIREPYSARYSGVNYQVNLKKAIQISAPMSPGSSGGAVFNDLGEIIGITTFSRAGGENLNFAIPINAIRTVDGELLTLDRALRKYGLLPAEEEMRQQADALRYQQKYKDAVELYNKAVNIKPDYAEAYLGLGMAYKEMGIYKKAVDSLKQYIALTPDNPMAYYELGLIYKEMEEYDKSIEALEKAVDLRYYFEDAYAALAEACKACKKYDQPIAGHRQTLAKKPDSFDAHYNLGAIYMKLMDYPKAIESFDRAAQINPKSFEALNNLGFSAVMSEQNNQAIKALEEAVKLKGDSARAHANLCLAYSKRYLINNDKADIEKSGKEFKLVEKLDKPLSDVLANLVMLK